MTDRQNPWLATRALTRKAAAAYVGVGVVTFNKLVKEGIYPCATLGARRWDRKALDAAMDKLSGFDASLTPYDLWKAGKRHEG